MGRRIAVVEDDPGVAGMLRDVLELDGFQVTLVRDGTRAMGIIRSGEFDAILLDVMLPGKDGIALMREIRGNEATRSLPVVMLSAKTDNRTTWEGWQAGCDLYVSKPFDPEELLRNLREIVDRS